MQTEGMIVRSVSGFYTVETDAGCIECKARGRFRKEKLSPLVGDRVRIEAEEGQAVVSEILPRRSAFIRPPVANLDLLVLFASDAIPVSDPFLLDRICSNAALQGVPVVICVNKCDIRTEKSVAEIYERSGIPTVRTSTESGEGIVQLKSLISGKFCAFTGNSGVGKSSMLNRLDAALRLPTGEVSEKLGRGRHTTRHVQVYTLSDGTRIADTPGFSAFDCECTEISAPDAIAGTFPEFRPYIGQCRYADCSHRREPDCAVRTAVAQGRVMPSRYDSYCRLYELALQRKQWE